MKKAVGKKKIYTAQDFLKGIRSGNRTILAKAITFIESTRADHQEIAHEIVQLCLPFSGQSIRVGITGVPGVGKSTFIEAIGSVVLKKQGQLAILAVDPSSKRSGGSILGDKTRMEYLAANPEVFIRPSPSSGELGGVAKNTRETIILLEAAGFDTIFVETVGVGQSEVAVHSIVDFFLLLMLSGAGDELQGIKRGIMEMADALVITKADGNNLTASKRARIEYQNAMHLFPPTETGWTVQVLLSSSLTGMGIEEVWQLIDNFRTEMKSKGWFDKKRKLQAINWMHEVIFQELKNEFLNEIKGKNILSQMEKDVADGKLSPYLAAKKLLKDSKTIK